MQPPAHLLDHVPTDFRAEASEERDSEARKTIYEPLELTENSIRLVDIVAPAEDGSVRAELRTAELRLPRSETELYPTLSHAWGPRHTCRDPEFYTAVSYAWGPKHPQREVTVNGTRVKVGVNLHELLLNLMGSQLWHDDRMSMESLWIDAISIDQKNVKEKNHQVHLMGQIYSHATKVLVWLGTVPRTCDVLTEVEKVIGQRAARENYVLRYNLDSQEFASILQDALEDLHAAGRSASVRQVLEAVHILSTAPYWQRLWIMQEVRLARDRRVLFGNSSIIWSFWQKMYQFYASAFDGPCLVPSSLIRLTSRPFGAGYAIEVLLESCKQAKCQEIRDRLFGVLSMTEDGADFLINYEDAPSTVISRAMQHFRRSDSQTLFQALNEAFDWPIRTDAAWPFLDNLIAKTFSWPSLWFGRGFVTSMLTSILLWAQKQNLGAAIDTEYCLEFIWRRGFLKEIRLGYCCHPSCLPPSTTPVQQRTEGAKEELTIQSQSCKVYGGSATFSVCCRLGDRPQDHTHDRRSYFRFIMAARLKVEQGVALLEPLLEHHFQEESLKTLASHCEQSVMQAEHHELAEAEGEIDRLKAYSHPYATSHRGDVETRDAALRNAKRALRHIQKRHSEAKTRRQSFAQLDQILEPYPPDLRDSARKHVGYNIDDVAWTDGVFNDLGPAHLSTRVRSAKVKAPKRFLHHNFAGHTEDHGWEERAKLMKLEPGRRAWRAREARNKNARVALGRYWPAPFHNDMTPVSEV